MDSKHEMELADAFALNIVLLSVIDAKSWLVLVDTIEQLNTPAQTRARLLAQLAKAFEALGVDPATTPVQAALLQALDACRENGQ